MAYDKVIVFLGEVENGSSVEAVPSKPENEQLGEDKFTKVEKEKVTNIR